MATVYKFEIVSHWINYHPNDMKQLIEKALFNEDANEVTVTNLEERANDLNTSNERGIICFKAKHEIMSITTKHKHCPDCGFKLANLG